MAPGASSSSGGAQKAKKERNHLQKQQSTVEEYFPFGCPGVPPPIRSHGLECRTKGAWQHEAISKQRKVGDIQSHQKQVYFRAKYETSNCDGGYLPTHTATNTYHGSVAGTTVLTWKQQRPSTPLAYNEHCASAGDGEIQPPHRCHSIISHQPPKSHQRTCGHER